MRAAIPTGLALAALLVVFSTAKVAAAPSYTIVDIGLLHPTDAASQSFRVSPGGVVTGRSFGNPTNAFQWTQGGGLVGLPNPTSPARAFCVGNGANDVGDIVGTGATTTFGSSPLPLLWHAGAVSVLPMPSGQTLGRANDVNDAHVAVGSVGSGSLEAGVIYSGGSASLITRLTSTGCFLRTAFGINNAGLIVGFGIDPGNAARNVGFVYDMVRDTSYEVGILPGMNGAIAFDVSESGIVTGSSSLNQGSGMPFVWRPGLGTQPIPLPPATSNGSGRGVNSSGLVVGNAGGVYSVPWLFDGGATFALQDLLPPGTGWDLSTNTSASALGISEGGIIVGTGVHNGATRAYAMIPDQPVAVELQRFDAVGRTDGIALSWQFGEPVSPGAVSVLAGPGEQGPWTMLEGVIRSDADGMSLLDADAAPGETRTYRLSVTDRGGATTVMGFATATRPGALTGSLALAAPSPNPASASTRLAFRIAAAEHVTLAVYDVRGRLVARLVDGVLAAGEHAIEWNGRADGGAAVPAGVYFATLASKSGTRTQRVAFVR